MYAESRNCFDYILGFSFMVKSLKYKNKVALVIHRIDINQAKYHGPQIPTQWTQVN